MTISIDPQKTNNKSLQPKGWLRYFSFSLDHKVIGIQYLVCGFLFYLIGGTLASAIRIELASPMSDFMPRDVYNQVLTLHGTIISKGISLLFRVKLKLGYKHLLA